MGNGRKAKAWLAAAVAMALAGGAWGQQAAAKPMFARGHRKRAPKPVGMTVLGPERVEAGGKAVYAANILYDNASTRLVEPVWAVAGDVTAARIGADGTLSVRPLSADASIEVVACFTDGKTAIAGTLAVTLVAPPPRTATVSDLEVHPRRPWNGWLDIDYTLATDPPGTAATVSLSAWDHERRCALPVKTLAGAGARGGSVKPGRHRLSWNLGADHPGIPAARVGLALDAAPSGPAAPGAKAFRTGGLKASFYDLGGPNPEASPWKSPYRDMAAFFAAREAALVTNTAYLGADFDFGYTERGTCRFPEKYARWTTEAFAVLFEGRIDIPETGTYTFGSLSDDGVSLYVDRKLVYETTKRQNFGDGMSAGTVALKAGRHDIAIAYYEGGGQQGLQLFWQKPSDSAPVLLPQSVLDGPCSRTAEKEDPSAEGLSVSFYDLDGMTSPYATWASSCASMKAFFSARSPVLVTNTAYVGRVLDFGYTPWHGTCVFPGKYANASADDFAALFTGHIIVPEAGNYRFETYSDDGSTLYIDNQLVFAAFDGQDRGNPYGSNIRLTAGEHAFALAYHERGERQGLRLYWQPPSNTELVLLPQSVLRQGNALPVRCPPVRESTPPAGNLTRLKAAISEYADALGTNGLWVRGRNTKDERAVYDRLLAPIQGDARALGGICEFAERKYREFDAMDEHETPRQWFYTWLKWRTVDDICELGDRDEFKRLQGLYGRDGADSLWFKGYEDRYFPTNGAAGRYLVVDLSGGPHAERWPAAFRDTVPVGGFNTDKYKLGKLVLRRIDPGSFTMGSPPDELGRFSNEDRHPVTLTKPYYIGLFEMTQRQWQLAMGSNPSQDKGAMRPVENTSYDDIRGRDAGSRWPATNAVDPGSLVGKLRAKTGLAFDLPTDAQWEHACRAGTQTALYTGEELADAQHDAAADEIARYGYDNGTHGGIPDGKGGYPDRHTTVGSYRPNAWGLYDMGGNVWELCRDWYAFSLGSAAATDPVGPPSGRERVRRGGAWDNSAWHCRSASRDHFAPSDPAFANGFRLACEAE